MMMLKPILTWFKSFILPHQLKVAIKEFHLDFSKSINSQWYPKLDLKHEKYCKSPQKLIKIQFLKDIIWFIKRNIILSANSLHCLRSKSPEKKKYKIVSGVPTSYSQWINSKTLWYFKCGFFWNSKIFKSFNHLCGLHFYLFNFN